MCMTGNVKVAKKKHVRNSVKKSNATFETYPRKTTNEIKAEL